MSPWVIKLGGAALISPEAVVSLAQAIVLLKQEGKSVVIVHGGESSLICEILQKNGLNTVGISLNATSALDAVAMGLIPVIATAGVDADWAASTIALAVKARILIYATDERGILDLNELPYDSLTLSQLNILMEKGGVTGGMLNKSRSIENALLGGVAKVCVTHALELKDLIETKHGGTLCVAMSRVDFLAKVKETEYAISG